ncbi:aminopeptidase P N-terminal domain-containing protein [Gemmatimonadota bacterium]
MQVTKRISTRVILATLPVIFFLLTQLPACSNSGGGAGEVPFVQPGSLISNEEYAARRTRLMDQVPDGVVIILGAVTPVETYRFFQNNDFFYFSGVEIPNAVLVIDGVNRESTLFFTMDERTARGEGLPDGLAADPGGSTGIERAEPSDGLEPYLAGLSRQVDVFYTSHFPGELTNINTKETNNSWRRTMTENPLDGRLTRELQFVEYLKREYPRVEVKDCASTIWNMRRIKSPAEVALVREAARIGVAAHNELIRNTGVGMTENALAAIFEFICRREGAQELAYPTILMSGPNHPFGHYHIWDRTLQEGEFVILDAGPDYAYYNADISTSFPVNGRFTEYQRELYELANGIREVCLANYGPGVSLADVGEKVEEWLVAQGHDPTEQRFRGLIRWGGYNHSIGMATHDVQDSFGDANEPLQVGFVFACDVNMPIDEDFGLRLEDTVVITEDGCENLSVGVPRTIAEVEAMVRSRGILEIVKR